MSNLRFPITRFYRTFSYAPIFRYTSWVYANGIPVHLFVYPPGDVQYIILHVLHNPGGGNTGIGKMFTFAHVGWWNIVQTRMLHRLLVGCCQCRERWQHIRAETSKRQKGEIWWNNSGMNRAFSFWFLTLCFHEFFWCECYVLLWITTTRQKLQCVCVIKQ